MSTPSLELYIVAQLLCGHDSAVVLGFRGGSAKVRSAHDAGTAQNVFGGEVLSLIHI